MVKGRGVGGEEILDGAHRSRAHGDAAAREGREEGALGRGGDFVEFAVDGVFLDGAGGDRLKRAETDMEREIGVGDALGG